MKKTKVPVFDLKGKEIDKIGLGTVFTTPFRPDIIKRVVLASRRNRQIPHGVDSRAGKRTTAESWGPGRGAARVPRVKGSRTSSASRGAFAPFTVGGRRTHPPNGNKKLSEKVNKKERQLARDSAIAATGNVMLVESRGHIIEEIKSLPLVVSNDLETITTTREVQQAFSNLGLSFDIAKAKRRSSQIRAGRGKRRGRRYKRGKSVLVVIGNDQGIRLAGRNLPGVDIVQVEQLNVEHLAPGTHPGRLTLWTVSAIESLKSREAS
ncbi:MAG: 50S ribosomal protein L4 [Candidatus Thorarchaeota archaeon]